MGEKDLTENYLEAYNDVFADIINVLLCGGQVILQEHLEADGNKTIYKADKKVHEQERDIAKFWKDGQRCLDWRIRRMRTHTCHLE